MGDLRDDLIRADLWDGADPRDPTADIAAAWEIVERCTRIGPVGYRQVRGLPVATWFMAHFEAAALWSCTAPEAAETICRCALAAVEGRPTGTATTARR